MPAAADNNGSAAAGHSLEGITNPRTPGSSRIVRKIRTRNRARTRNDRDGPRRQRERERGSGESSDERAMRRGHGQP